MKAGIAGAGIMGRLLAFALQRAGWQVSLFDYESERNCSMAAVGLLTPTAELAKADSMIFQMGVASIQQHWPEFLQQLSQKIYFQQTGSVAVAHPRDKAELTQFVRAISDKVIDSTQYQSLSADTLKTLEPSLDKFNEGYYFPADGCLDNQTLLAVLAQDLQNKIHWHKDHFVEEVVPGKIITNGQTHTFDMVFDCRGLGAKSIFKDLRGVRGEMIWLHAPDVHITRPVRILHPRYCIYIAPRPNQIYLVGASELESEAMDDISVRSMLELLTAVFYVHPGFSEARVIKTVTQCRPTLPDHLPHIKYADGFAAINGLYRHGFLVAPALVNDIVLWLQKGISFVRYDKLWKVL